MLGAPHNQILGFRSFLMEFSSITKLLDMTGNKFREIWSLNSDLLSVVTCQLSRSAPSLSQTSIKFASPVKDVDFVWESPSGRRKCAR